MPQYNSYRIFISEQPGIFISETPKEIYFMRIIVEMIQNAKTDYYYKRDHHLFFYLDTPIKNISIFQFGHERMVRTPKAGTDKISLVEEPQTPFVHIIIDYIRQIILIENNTLAFKEIDFVVKRIESYFEKKINSVSDVNYKVQIRAITKENDFWDEVDEATKIFSLELSFNAPNLFGGRFEAAKIVKEAHKETNFEEFKLKLLSSRGLLHIIKEDLSDFIKLIAAGGGKYKLTLRKRGERNVRRIDSSKKSIKENLPINIADISGADLNARLEAIDGGKQNDIPKEIGPGEPINPLVMPNFTFTPAPSANPSNPLDSSEDLVGGSNPEPEGLPF